MIRQIINKYETVQTKLQVDVDGIRIRYYREPYEFAYVFEADVSKEDEEKGVEAIKRVISVMESQSYDHGSQWRRTSFTSYYNMYFLHARVEFRRRDAG